MRWTCSPNPLSPNRSRPDPADERAHPRDRRAAVERELVLRLRRPGQGIGGWVRLGLMPNESTAWINALLCGPDMPTIAVGLRGAFRRHRRTIELALEATEPLRTYR